MQIMTLNSWKGINEDMSGHLLTSSTENWPQISSVTALINPALHTEMSGQKGCVLGSVLYGYGKWLIQSQHYKLMDLKISWMYSQNVIMWYDQTQEPLFEVT